MANFQNQVKNDAEAQKKAKEKQQEDLMNIQVVQNNLGALKEIGDTAQKSAEDAKKKVMDQPVPDKINTALM